MSHKPSPPLNSTVDIRNSTFLPIPDTIVHLCTRRRVGFVASVGAASRKGFSRRRGRHVHSLFPGSIARISPTLRLFMNRNELNDRLPAMVEKLADSVR